MSQSKKNSLSELVDGMLGARFRLGGQGPKEFYCFGVLLYLLRECAGVDIEDPFVAKSDTKVRQMYESFIQLPCSSQTVLRPLDAIFYRRPSHDAHVSVVENGKWAVSCEDPWGPTRVLLCEELKRGEMIFRHKALVLATT